MHVPEPPRQFAHPAFTAHFRDRLYDDPAGEFAPFGTDEGADLLAEWEPRRGLLGPRTRLIDLALGGDGDVASYTPSLDPREFDDAVLIVGAGFALLRLTGRIDAEGKQLTLAALDALIARYGPQPPLVRQRDDLRSWTG